VVGREKKDSELVNWVVIFDSDIPWSVTAKKTLSSAKDVKGIP
jgi:hypothetical protein